MADTFESVNDEVLGAVLGADERAPSGDAAPRFEGGILHADVSMRSLVARALRAAPRGTRVLLRGETGTGKELLARLLHDASPRRERPFVVLHASVAHELGDAGFLERLAAARGGTFFLDEVAELPARLQARLLLFLEEAARMPDAASARLVCATSRFLEQEVEVGRFRSDLLYRLRVVPLDVPPLRERGDDVVVLAKHFVKVHNDAGSSRQVQRITPGALRLLRDHEWPGNVRELENAIEYAFLFGEGPLLADSDLPPDLQESRPKHSLRFDFERDDEPADAPGEESRLRRALERSGGSRQIAAKSLGMSRATLWRKIKAYGIDE